MLRRQSSASTELPTKPGIAHSGPGGMRDAVVSLSAIEGRALQLKYFHKYLSHARRGQILVLLALTLPVLLGATAMSADVGLLYFNWQQLQTSADYRRGGRRLLSAVRSGTSVSLANSYASINGISQPEITSTTISADHSSLNMQLNRTVPYSFALLLGLVTGCVSVQATAQILTIGKTTGVTPIGIDYRTVYSGGQVVQLQQGQVGPGNWGPLALGGSGASNLSQNIEYGYQGSIAIGALAHHSNRAGDRARLEAPSTT